MAILFNSKLNTGSLNSLTSNGTSSGSPVFVQTEKGLAIELSSGKSVSWTISSSNITNIVSFIKGIGTYRVTLNATNIDVSKTTFDYQFQNSTGTYNSITTVTITATSGRILVNKLVLLNGTDEINQLQAGYYNAQPLGVSKRGFVLDKPTDLSSQARSSLTSLFTDTFSTDTSSNYTGGTNVGSVTWNVGEYLTFLASGSSYMTIVRSGVLSTTLPTTVIIRAKSSVLTTTLGLWNGSTYVQSTETLSTEYKNFVFRNHVSSTATMTLRPNIVMTTGQDLVIDSIQTYTETGLIASYNMVKTGNVLVDTSGNGYNATVPIGRGIYVSTSKGLASNNINSTSGGSDITIPFLTLTDFSVCYKIGKYSLANGSCFFLKNSRYIVTNGGSIRVFQGSETNFTPVVSALNLNNSTVVFTYNNTTLLMSCYVNGILAGTLTLASALGTSVINNLWNVSGYGGVQFNAEFQDTRVFNRILSATEITQYHNQFVQPTLIEDFSDAGADGVTKTDAPVREWERVSGTWKVGENVVSNTQMVVGGPNFSTNVGWNLSGATISGGVYTGTTTGLNYCTSLLTLTAGKRYKVEVNILTSSNNAKVYVGGKNTETLPVGFSTVYVVMDSVSNQLVGFNDLVGTSNYLSITEVPQLETMTNGTKYLENVTAGIIAIPSQTAYGSWEFDWYKGNDANGLFFCFIADRKLTYNASNGYNFIPWIGEQLYLEKNDVGASQTKIGTTTAYFQNNTWYRIRITRTTAGVFTLLIKGGAFTPTAGYDGWTLVSASGGSGSNPVTDTTYSVSSYFVMDLDAGDRVANIVIRDGIKQ